MKLRDYSVYSVDFMSCQVMGRVINIPLHLFSPECISRVILLVQNLKSLKLGSQNAVVLCSYGKALDLLCHVIMISRV